MIPDKVGKEPAADVEEETGRAIIPDNEEKKLAAYVKEETGRAYLQVPEKCCRKEQLPTVGTNLTGHRLQMLIDSC